MSNPVERELKIQGRQGRACCQGVCGWLISFVCVALLYIVTLAPDLVWQDQGDYQYQAAKLNLNRPGDVVRVHPLLIVTAHGLGRLLDGDYAYAANLVSALSMAVAAANLWLLVVWLSGSTWAGVVAAGTFAFGHTVWFVAVQAQSYGLSSAALSGVLLMTVAYLRIGKNACLYAMGLVAGLGFSAHVMSQIGFAVIMAWLFIRSLKRKLPGLCFVGIIGAWALGAGLVWMVIAMEVERSGNLGAALMSSIWGQWGDAVFNMSKVAVLLKQSALFFVLNFPTPLILLAIPGVFGSFRSPGRPMAAVLLISMVLYALFAVRYDVPNQNNFFLPMYMLISVYLGLGFAVLAKKRFWLWAPVSALLLLALPATYWVISQQAQSRQVELGTRRHIPYRDVYTYYLLPWQHHQIGPRRLATEMFDKLPAEAVIAADRTTIPPLQYVQEIEKHRPDLRILLKDRPLAEVLKAWIPSSRIFTISDAKPYYPNWVEQQSWLKPFAISDEENIFEIIIPPDHALWSSGH